MSPLHLDFAHKSRTMVIERGHDALMIINQQAVGQKVASEVPQTPKGNDSGVGTSSMLRPSKLELSLNREDARSTNGSSVRKADIRETPRLFRLKGKRQ